jgi:putative endonuclease
MFEGFSQKYNVHNLVYYEEFNDVQESLIKSRGLKKWKRQWNIELIEKFNPQWKDLYDEISGFLLPFFKGTSFAGMTDSVQE